MNDVDLTPCPRHPEDLLLQHLRSYLGIVDETAIDVVRGRVRRLPLAAGETLMRQGEPGDSLYPPVSLVKEVFAHLQALSPAVGPALTRRITQGLRTENERPAPDRPVTMALLPVIDGVDALELATALASQLALRGRAAVLDAAEAGRLLGAALRDDDGTRRRVSQLIDETEGTHDFVLLAAGAQPDFRTGCCVRHADEILLLADAARGFAHLGICRALREQGIEIDVVGGTSIGAVMSLLMAVDLCHEGAEALARRAFQRNPTGDWSLLPLLSLVKGQRLRRVVADSVAECVGPDAGIEDLWTRYFYVASNFSPYPARCCSIGSSRAAGAATGCRSWPRCS